MISANLLTTAVVSLYFAQANAANYADYPSVSHTATINGFADPIYSGLPECAKPCVEEDTDSTPCPYWDPGCLCMMSNWGAPVAQCIAENCKGVEVSTATSLATSICSKVGVESPYWYIASSDANALKYAAEATVTEDSNSSVPVETSTPEPSAPVTSTQAEASTQAETSTPEPSAPVTSTQAEASTQAETSTPETSAPAQSSAQEQLSTADKESSSSAAASSDAPEVDAQENAASYKVPGQILFGLSAISFAALLL